MDFQDISYKKHQNGHVGMENNDKVLSWVREDTVDYWRHERMYKNINPLLLSYPKASWLTIGDGRYGTDAHYISKYNKDVMASDINGFYLQKALENGFISKYSIENAESLSFNDSAFDFVLCKEAYHHFPRPMIALYEMIRIACQGIVLIEPNDPNIVLHRDNKLVKVSRKQSIINTIKDILGIKRFEKYDYETASYETVGNYVYSISEREIEKVALGLNLPFIAFKGINDFYIEGVENEIYSTDSLLYKTIEQQINTANERTKLGYRQTGMLVAIILKTKPNDKFLKELFDNGFECYELPNNPYIND